MDFLQRVTLMQNAVMPVELKKMPFIENVGDQPASHSLVGRVLIRHKAAGPRLNEYTETKSYLRYLKGSIN